MLYLAIYLIVGILCSLKARQQEGEPMILFHWLLVILMWPTWLLTKIEI
jgi:hypothetical protein